MSSCSPGTFGEEPDGWLSWEQVVAAHQRELARRYEELTRNKEAVAGQGDRSFAAQAGQTAGGGR